jgi:hypothetical protein
VEYFVTPHLVENTLEESPIVLLALSHMFHSSSKPPQKSLKAKNVVSRTLRA